MRVPFRELKPRGCEELALCLIIELWNTQTIKHRKIERHEEEDYEMEKSILSDYNRGGRLN